MVGWKITRSPSYLQYLISGGRLSCSTNYLRAVKLLTRNLVIVKKQNCQSNNPRWWNEAISRLAGWTWGAADNFLPGLSRLWAHFITHTFSTLRISSYYIIYFLLLTVFSFTFFYILFCNYSDEILKNISFMKHIGCLIIIVRNSQNLSVNWNTNSRIHSLASFLLLKDWWNKILSTFRGLTCES